MPFLQVGEDVKKEADISKNETARAVCILFDSMAESLANGDRVEIRGLCSFFVKEYESCTGRNPKTGEHVTVKAKKLPFFKPGRELKGRVDGFSIQGYRT
ncbi:MAG: HU family DNA-binding protein [Pseudomonadota bacterium]